MLYVEMDPLGSDTWKLEPVIELIKNGGVGVIPTDTVYNLHSISASFYSFCCLYRLQCCFNLWEKNLTSKLLYSVSILKWCFNSYEFASFLKIRVCKQRFCGYIELGRFFNK